MRSRSLAPSIEVQECILNQMTQAIQVPAVVPVFIAMAPRRYYRLSSLSNGRSHNSVGVVAPDCQQVLGFQVCRPEDPGQQPELDHHGPAQRQRRHNDHAAPNDRLRRHRGNLHPRRQEALQPERVHRLRAGGLGPTQRKVDLVPFMGIAK